MANDMHEVGFVMPSSKVVHVPSAHRVRYMMCDDPKCKALHVYLIDQVGQPFAEATLSSGTLERMRQLIEAKGETKT